MCVNLFRFRFDLFVLGVYDSSLLLRLSRNFARFPFLVSFCVVNVNSFCGVEGEGVVVNCGVPLLMS